MAQKLRDAADGYRWLVYRDSDPAARAGINRSAKGPVEQARRLVVRAYNRRAWGLPGGDYKAAAVLLTNAGYRTTPQDFKNGSRGALIEHAVPAAAIADFVAAVCAIWPAFEWWRLVTRDDPRGSGKKAAQKPQNLRRNIKTAQVKIAQVVDPAERFQSAVWGIHTEL
jgi:hypothetical protein